MVGERDEEGGITTCLEVEVDQDISYCLYAESDSVLGLFCLCSLSTHISWVLYHL